MSKQKKKASSRASTPARSATAAAPSTPRWLPWALATALVGITVGAYSGIRHHEFVDLDDGLYVVQNTNVTRGLTQETVAWAFTTGHAANWHPLTWISHQLDVSLFGLRAGGHHLTSLVWHVLNTLLLFGLVRSLTGAVWRSAIVAAFFAVHPAHVESVAWVAERKDLLSTFFWILTTWVWVAWTRRPSAARLAGALVCFALGLMSKPMLVSLPFTLLLLDVWPLERTNIPFRRRLVEKVPFFLLAMISSLITVLVQQQGGAVSTLEILPFSHRVANAAVAYALYLKHLVWPVDLAVFYPYPREVPGASLAIAGVLLAVISAGAWLSRRAHPYLLVGCLWFIGTMVPVIGLIQVGTQSHADRYTYVPYIGLFVAIVWIVHAQARKWRVPTLVPQLIAAAVVVALAVGTHAQAATWRNSEALWTRAVAVTTGNARAHNLLGAVYGNSGRVQQAEAEFREALRLRPDAAEAIHILPNLGRALSSQGKYAEAIPYLERARPLKPTDVRLMNDLAIMYITEKRTADAIALWREAVRIDANAEYAWFLLGMALGGEGMRAEARQAFLEVLRINPSHQDARRALAELR